MPLLAIHIHNPEAGKVSMATPLLCPTHAGYEPSEHLFREKSQGLMVRDATCKAEAAEIFRHAKYTLTVLCMSTQSEFTPINNQQATENPVSLARSWWWFSVSMVYQFEVISII